ncbi:hypothetical protein BD410DRAFT_74291 [Rickenella mellea]|uniref:Uncharacterized protein n=1 Tax=Rickenella mellea TaxID=50990 RepID=A0A4Y7QD55_9AGAM|nr:hypothetical protein BD410DRAFT_74291 [Rickenella mellea]
MFADVCLSCSKPVFGSRAYCCDECAFNDQPSPSLSSTSSVYQSPSLNAAFKGVPGLVNASGSGRHSRNRSSLSSSSTSSYLSTPSAPALTDDDESLSDLDRDVLDLRFNALQHQSQQTDHADPKPDQGADAESLDIKTRRTAISYARRPSATNTRSTIPVPMLKQHTGSDSRSYSERQAHSRPRCRYLYPRHCRYAAGDTEGTMSMIKHSQPKSRSVRAVPYLRTSRCYNRVSRLAPRHPWTAHARHRHRRVRP